MEYGFGDRSILCGIQIVEESLISLSSEVPLHFSVQQPFCLSRRCGMETDRMYALRIYAHMAVSGLDTRITLGNHLVHILGKLGCDSDARRVFDRRDLWYDSSWDSLINDLLNCGRLRYAIDLYMSIQKFGLLLIDSHTIIALLKACVKLKDLGCGLKLQLGITSAGLLEVDVFIGSALLDMFSKCGSLINAQQTFARLSVRNIVCWNALLGAFLKHGYNKEVLDVWNKMNFEGTLPDAVTFICSLKACANLGDQQMALEIHEHVKTIELLRDDLIVGNTLVDVFAKLGLFEIAQQVFDNLPLQDAISWNSLIAGYLEHGYCDEAVEWYERMQVSGVSQNPVTYICALKSFSSIRAPWRGLEIHGELERLGLLEQDRAFGNILVDMYAQGDWFSKAKEVFDRLLVRDVVAWNALIAAYVEHGNGKEALNQFELMQHEQVFPDSITLACSLKSCILTGDINQGREIHTEIARKDLLLSNLVVGNALVDFYAKCSMITIAQEVFDRLFVRDVISWNIMIAGYAERGYCEEALGWLDAMESQGVIPDSVTFVYSLQACVGDMNIMKARILHGEIERKGLLEKDPMVGNALLDMYCKFGLLCKAQEVFTTLLVQDHFSWNTLMTGYAEHGSGEDTLNCFDKMECQGVAADAVTFICGLRACAGMRALQEGRKMHAEIERRGLLVENCPLGSTLVDMYSKCGAITKAQEVFDQLPVHDSVSWNALLAGYTEQGYAEDTLRCLHLMRLEGVPLNVAAVVFGLKACVSLMATSETQELLAEIKKKSFLERNYLVSSSLVDMCVKCSSIEKAQEVFDQLLVRDAVSWNVLMTGYIDDGQLEETLTCLKQMQQEGIAPDAVTYISSLRACGNMGAALEGQELHAEITMKGLLEREPSLGNTLIYMYSKCGSIIMAQNVFEKLSIRDVVSWNTIIAGYAQLGQNEGIFHNFTVMLQQNVEPDLITFVIILNACSRSCLFHESHLYFEVMSRHYGIVPCLEHHSCIVDLLGRSGHLDEATAMIEKMPILPNVVVWHTLLGASRRWGHKQVGNQAFMQAVNLDQQDSAAYVLLSHVHANDTMERSVKAWCS